MKTIKIGIVGYSDVGNYSKKETDSYASWIAFYLRSAEIYFRQLHGEETMFEMVGGLTDMGINKYAYEYASHKSKKATYKKLIGFACSKASEYPCFPVDEKYIIGTEWGDESDSFLEYIDVLVKIGGGEQSKKEWDTFTAKYPDKIYREFPSHVTK